jgi:formylmethanofuran dehydrogenase subunit C
MSLTLQWKAATTLPVDGTLLRPESFLEHAAAQTSRMQVRLGNTSVELGELFAVQGERGDERLTLEGDLSHVHGLARGMSLGELIIHGKAGPEMGAEMTGGSINVEGSAGDWAAAELRGGFIRIRGSAGSFLGGAYPGSRLGMRDGVILVEGSAGDDVGCVMRRGLIAVRGAVGAGLGRAMVAGTILVLGDAGRRFGAGMKRGTLVVTGLTRPPQEVVLPTFARAGRFRSPFLALYYRQLAGWGFAISEAVSSAWLERYNGDLVVGGQGEILAGRNLA